VQAAQVSPTGTWTIVAAGDILLDRGVARQVKVLGKGVDFPYDGGTAEITGYTCCSGFGYRVPTYRRTGDRGAMRELLKSADLAMANLESPIDDQFRYHTGGTTFTGDPKLLDGVQRAGLDFVSLANNHIGNAGSDGILETVAELDRRGIAHSGAGKNFTAARQAAILEARGTKIAVIGCDDIGGAWTSGNKVGSRACNRAMTADISAAKRVADVVVVYPHWGIEYRATPTARQRQYAKDWIAAGADVIIGNHPHWAGAVEQLNGKLAFYALGNFVFDQMWREQTMEGIVLELTFQGSTLRQAWLHPTLVIDQAQPNFMDPAGDGQRVLQQVRRASQGLLPY
jgi:poly-gamma-glutamate synthesis protein (capsule biosynthesis protein)